ncbi:inactive phospholipase C-like protein 1 [Amphiura filiformis]|uniref:inactive phospholipase C-like protein 1 n=1 Tax=Amphiura filiformis TaxID=82378 RepID=UPI003B20FACC
MGQKQSRSKADRPTHSLTPSDCLAFMQAGCELIKVRSQSRQYHRVFSLNEDMTELRWHPTSKKPDKARILVEAIKEVRIGKNTDTFRARESTMEFPEDCAFSVIFGDHFETLDLVASSADEANIWVTGLSYLTGGKKNKSPEAIERSQDMRDRWLREMFNKAAGDDDNQLDEFEVMQLMKKLNNSVASMRIRQKFKEITSNKCRDANEKPTISSNEFCELFKDMTTRPEIYFLLVRYASSEFMTTDDLLIFLEAEQGMAGVTRERCLTIIEKYEPSAEGRELGHLGIDGFTRFLLSEECDIFDPHQRRVCQDMTQPLSHYFIAASHNTYLTEDQLKGPSSVTAYVSALQKGCRWVELDCWDGANGEPIIYHGHTLTSKISFKAVVEAINQHAFETSDYPVILAIENHCCVEQQKVMAHYIKTVFGDKLYEENINEDAQYLPSPEQLRHRLLIKGKKLDTDCQEDQGEVTDEDEGGDSERRRLKKEGAVKKRVLIKELSDLVTLCKSVRFDDFQEAAQNQKYWEICSFSEGVANKFSNTCGEDFVNHNKRYLSRVFPNPNRVDSSNYNPQDLWNAGCQIVALNYQTPGLMTDLYDGKFHQNGQCGYVLKPSIMREAISYFSANSRDIIPGTTPQILHIKIISGQRFPKPKGSGSKGDVIDPYVSMEIFGIPADCSEERTKAVQHNGYNPIFDESFEFTVNLPELALVRFVVLDDDYIGDEFIGQYTIPFECLQPGYRHLTLLSNTGESLEPASLFVHVAVTNKRGGGKPTKRGMSVKKSRRTREYTHLRTVGVKGIDENFKSALQPLKEATDLRENVQTSMTRFKEACGLASIANLKQCIRLLASRVAGSSETVALRLEFREGCAYLEAQGNLPEMLKKALNCFESMVSMCKQLMDEAEEIVQRIDGIQKKGLVFHDQLNVLLTKEGLKGKKLTRATENFAWNIRVLKGQGDVLARSKKECLDWMKQIKEAGIALGLLEEEDGSSRPDGVGQFIPDGDSSDSDSDSDPDPMVQNGQPSAAAVPVGEPEVDHRAEELDQKLECEVNENNAEPDLDESFELEENQKDDEEQIPEQDVGVNESQEVGTNEPQKLNDEQIATNNNCNQQGTNIDDDKISVDQSTTDDSQPGSDIVDLQIVEPDIDFKQGLEAESKQQEEGECKEETNIDLAQANKTDCSDEPDTTKPGSQGKQPEIEEPVPEATKDAAARIGSEPNHQTQIS